MYSLLFEGDSSLTGSIKIIRQLARSISWQVKRLTEVNMRLRFLGCQSFAVVVPKEFFEYIETIRRAVELIIGINKFSPLSFGIANQASRSGAQISTNLGSPE